MNYLKARKRLSDILSEIISERKEKRLTEKDLLGCLLNSKSENGEKLCDDQIADNIIGVLFAAQDTTASIMTWILKYLHDDVKLLQAVKVYLSANRKIYRTKIFWKTLLLLHKIVDLGVHFSFLGYPCFCFTFPLSPRHILLINNLNDRGRRDKQIKIDDGSDTHVVIS